jgi:hypothetical protein
LLDLGSTSGERAFVVLGGTERAALGTGLFAGELLGLLLDEELECSFGKPLCRDGGNLLHGPEVDIQTGPVVAEGPLGNDFPPLGREVSELVEFLRSDWRCVHRSS